MQQQNDILIFGSSRAMYHYNPEIIADSLMMTCYNVGYGGQGILYHNAVLDVILERYTPKIIVLDILTDELCERIQSYDRLSILNPYVQDYPVLWNTLSLVSPFERVKHVSFIYPFNSTLLKVIAGNIKRSGKDISSNGFTPREGIWGDTINQISFNKDTTQFDDNKLIAFDQFCHKCIENNIDLYIAISPMFAEMINTSSSVDYIQNKCSNLDIPFIDFSNNCNYISNKLFLDDSHLNKSGTDIFTKDIASKILKEMNNK